MTWTEAQKADIRVDLKVLYQAGTQRIPKLADDVSSIAIDMSTIIDDVNAHSAMLGDNSVVVTSLDLAVDCANGVASSVTTLNNLADGVVRIADDFVRQDDYARQQYEKMRRNLGLTEKLGDDENDDALVPYPINKGDITAPGADVPGPPSMGGGHIDSDPGEKSPHDDESDRDKGFDTKQGGIPHLEGS